MTQSDYQLLMTQRAVGTIEGDVRAHVAQESGGILGGTLDGQRILIVEAGTGGSNVRRSPASFCGDPKADAGNLEAIRRDYGSMHRLMGHWHSHPDGMMEFSSIDAQMARSLVRTLGEHRPHVVLIAARSLRTGKVGLAAYLQCGSAGSLRPIRHQVIAGNDARIAEILDAATTIPPIRDTTIWSDGNFTFFETPAGRARIKKELGQLRQLKGFKSLGTRGIQRQGSRYLAITLSVQGMQLEIDVPPEYPLNAPLLYLRSGRRRLPIEGSRRPWNSLRSLTELVRKFLAHAGEDQDGRAA